MTKKKGSRSARGVTTKIEPMKNGEEAVERAKPLPKWRWSEQAVDRTKEHIELRFGDAGVSPYEEWVPVALIGPPKGNVFPVQLIIDSKGAKHPEMMEAARKELDFYLTEVGGPEPWGYAIYHCNTAANMYSEIHWSYFPEGFEKRRLASKVVQISPSEKAIIKYDI